MATATHDLPPLPRAGNAASFADAGLFALIDELRNCEKRRDDLLANLSFGHSDQVRAVAEKACDAARVIYQQIAATKPTTVAGVLRQLELAAKGWVGAPIIPIALAALREIATAHYRLKQGGFRPFPAAPIFQRASHYSIRVHPRAVPARPDGDVRLGSMIAAFAPSRRNRQVGLSGNRSAVDPAAAVRSKLLPASRRRSR